MEKEINKVLKYFAIFAYHPTLDEIHTFLQAKIDKQKLKYTPPQYSIKEVKNLELRVKNSKKKLNNWRFRAYLKLISLFPQIRLVGLSGSISMMNATEDDDIDLFIITAKNRLFTGRLIALVLAQILGLRRSRERFRDSATQIFQKTYKTEKFTFASSQKHKDKVCLNLFFDERDLKVPKFKQTEFVGHEVLQMKPILIKGDIYERFLEENRWVFKLFPNSKERISNFKFLISNQFQISNFKNSKLNKNLKLKIKNLGDWVEDRLKKFQMRSINRHKTSEIITPSQLWFHPDDFEKKIRKTL